MQLDHLVKAAVKKNLKKKPPHLRWFFVENSISQ